MTTSHDERDAGLGLIELIVALVVAGIVLAGIGAIFVRSWQTQEEVMSVSEATNRGQLVASAIERAVRNGLYVQVSDSGTVLRVSTSLSGSLKCQGFRVTSDAGGTARYSMSASTLGTSDTWPEWQPAVMAQPGTPYFEEPSPGVIRYSFQLETESAPVRFAGEVSPRSIQEGDSDSCWS